MSRGFTLIELLVVFLIIGTALAIAVPLLGPVSSETRVKSDIREFSAFLREARAEAISNNQDVVVTVDTTRRTYATSSAQNKGKFAKEVKLLVTAAAVEQINSTTAGFRFFPDGSSTGGEVSLEAGSAHYLVKVEWLTGRVSTDAR